MKKCKALFPMFFDISEKKIVVIGGGKIATRRIKALLDFADKILVIAPKVSDDILQMGKDGRILFERRTYNEKDINGADIVLAATDNVSLNDEIYTNCKHLGIMVNVASDKEKCDFYFPGIVKKDSIIIGISAGGNDHKGAKEMRQKIQKYLESES